VVVSILILLDVSLKVFNFFKSSSLKGVSILILLDVSLKDDDVITSHPGDCKFQSLFFWMCR